MVSSIKDSLYFAVNREWLNSAVVPDEYSSWGTFQELRMNTVSLMLDVVKSSHNPRIATLWGVATNRIKVNKDGLAVLRALSKDLDVLETPEDFLKAIAELHKMGSSPIFRFGVESDFKKPLLNIGHWGQSGLGLPHRGFYMDPDKAVLRQKYVILLEKVFGKMRHPDPGDAARRVFNLEEELAKHHLTKETMRDPEATYNMVKINTMSFFKPYFKHIGVTTGSINVENPKYLAFLESWSWPVDDMRLYLKWSVVRSMSTALSDDYFELFFDFYGRTLSGQEKLKPIEERMLRLVESCLGEELGEEYVVMLDKSGRFTEDHKTEMKELVGFLQTSLSEMIEELDWMQPPTKKKALHKLHNIKVKIGFPDKFEDYTDLVIDPAASLVSNVIACRRYHWSREIAYIGKVVDPDKWEMLPQTVNAYYHPLRNEIVFPAAIMTAPFFIPGDDSVNYGGIGAIIGHEITHGFDDSGCKFDANGKMVNWWTATDKRLFDKKAAEIVYQYNQKSIEGRSLNGTLTQGENIADIGGLKIAYKAFQKSGTRTKADNRLFFKSYAKLYRNKTTPDATKLQIDTDPHAPGQFRVDVVVSNLKEFDEAFDINWEDAMYRQDKVAIW